jgi:membrane protein implicated in regulation of membrane protease activity
VLGFVGYLSAVLAFVPMLAFVLLGEFSSLPGSVAVGLTVVAFLSILLVFGDALGRRRATGTDRDRSSEETGSIWAMIPDWQYNGLYAESGASTRGEQERALRETQEQAAETERHLQKRSK